MSIKRRHRKIKPLVDNGDGTISVPLTQGKWALIDADCDQLAVIAASNWQATRSRNGKVWYARRNIPRESGGQSTQALHQLILPGYPEVDHKDGNGLNNCRSNLRGCTTAENNRNRGAGRNSTTGFKGVCFRADIQKFQAHICISRRKKHLGFFSTAELAHVAYCRAAEELHGEFARTK